MAFGKLLGRSRAPAPAKKSVPPPAKPAPAKKGAGGGLARLLEEGIHLSAEREAELAAGVSEGRAFYTKYNDSRLELAFSSFDEPMRHALFEIIFLLHVNDSSLSNISYTATRQDKTSGVPRYDEVPATADLYVEGAPHGVKGIGALSPVFRDDFNSFVQREFGRGPQGANGNAPIVCLQSIGSIGTISHKSGTSDLDLQVVYDLEGGSTDPRDWDDAKLRDALLGEQLWWMKLMATRQKLKVADLQRPEVKQLLQRKGNGQIVKTYPALYRLLVARKGNYAQELAGRSGKALRRHLTDELMRLIKRSGRISRMAEIRKGEALLKERVDRLQTYITEKYPEAEIYMFTCALEMYRAGRYTSSLEFKESSGSAYELILNYETLMPGIQFSSTIPSHFVFSGKVNNNPGLYQNLNSCAEFKALRPLREISPMLVDLGNTPDLHPDYVAEHSGAVYWEAFKASSGNLPKATLNLLRYEMLLDARFRKTVMQIIKEPKTLDKWVTPRPEDKGDETRELEDDDRGLPTWVLLKLEEEHELLRQDPWWLRYKTLKIGFGEPKGVEGVEENTRHLISKIIDLAFGLHLRVSDVFTKPGDTRKFESHREQVLLKFLRFAFPPGTGRRERLEHIFAGDVRAVNEFETDLRANFRWSLERTQKKIAGFDLKNLRRNSREIELWYQYYQQNFEPEPKVVQRTIMHQLMFPRGRLQVGFKQGEGWFFKSLQKESSVGKRFDTFGVLDHLPEEVTLVEGTGFLHGLATCIVNGYYGIVNQGTLRETRTALEFDAKHMDLGNALHNALAFIRPDFVDRLLDRILAFFPYQHYHYADFIHQDRRVQKVFVFYNLWRFGRLSLLYRDNLNTWCCEEFDHAEVEAQGEFLRQNQDALLGAEAVHESLDRFFTGQRLFVNEVELETWVNPNSTETIVPASQMGKKEIALSEAFKKVIYRTLPQKGR